jgi:hypothetical protein
VVKLDSCQVQIQTLQGQTVRTDQVSLSRADPLQSYEGPDWIFRQVEWYHGPSSLYEMKAFLFIGSTEDKSAKMERDVKIS